MDAYYHPYNDQFCFRSQPDDDWERFPSTTCEGEARTHKLYPIGAFCWIWDDE